MKRAYLFLLIVSFSVFAQESVKLTDELVDERGERISLTPSEAESYCSNLGLRLPSARDYAVFATQNGAVGIRETAYPGETGRLPDGSPDYGSPKYEEIWLNSQEGYYYIFQLDFYFNGSGYKYPNSYELGRYITSTKFEYREGEGFYGYWIFWNWSDRGRKLLTLSSDAYLGFTYVRCLVE